MGGLDVVTACQDGDGLWHLEDAADRWSPRRLRALMWSCCVARRAGCGPLRQAGSARAPCRRALAPPLHFDASPFVGVGPQPGAGARGRLRPAPGWCLFLRNRFDGSPRRSSDSFSSDSEPASARGTSMWPSVCRCGSAGGRRCGGRLRVRLVAADHGVGAGALMYLVTIRNRGFPSPLALSCRNVDNTLRPVGASGAHPLSSLAQTPFRALEAFGKVRPDRSLIEQEWLHGRPFLLPDHGQQLLEQSRRRRLGHFCPFLGWKVVEEKGHH
jgi:hypothetical protein